MIKIVALFRKLVLSLLVVGNGVAAIPFGTVSAASLDDPATPPVAQADHIRLERQWMREQLRFQREGFWLTQAQAVINRIQALIDKANQKGLDTSKVQAALDAFSTVIPTAQAAHNQGTPIISNHAGFDASGKVTDAVTAIETTQALAQVLKDTRLAMNGTGKALRQAIREFRQVHQKDVTPTP
jgi:hypothetical protein